MRAVTGLPEINLNGLDLNLGEIRSLISVRIQQKIMLPSLCELTFSGIAGELPQFIRHGDSFSCQIEGNALFQGRVSAMQYVYGASGERELRIRAYDELQILQQSQLVRAHVDVTVADLAREFLRDTGLRLDVHDDSPLWKWLLQHSHSNYEFLCRAADQTGLVFFVERGELHLFRLAGYGDEITLALGHDILEAQIDLNQAHQAEEVVTTGWQPLDFSLHRDGRRRSGEGVRYRVNEALANDGLARARSQSETDRRNASQKVLWAMVDGNADLRPGRLVEILGADEAANGRFVLMSAIHTVDSHRGFVTEIDSRPPAPALPEMGTIGTVGEVSQIGGPNGRIKVQLNAFEAERDIETEWLSVVVPGAGADKGFVILPEVGDTVFVLLTSNFTGQGVVLGGVYGSGNPPDDGVSMLGKRERFLWRSREGQSIRMDDGRGTLVMENRDGSVIELAPNQVRLIADGDLEIAAPGKTITIRGNQINFEQG